jgi:UPF0042 nucleotide-binding protein
MTDPTPTFPAGLPVLDGLAVPPPPAEILIITGMSGAGRTQAAGVLEDLGWYVVDNLPPQMIAPLAGMMHRSGDNLRRLAVVVDVRTGEFFQTLMEALEELRSGGTNHRIVFLDASDQALIKRYEGVRRPHPLQGEGSTLNGIGRERRLLAQLREQADHLVDTSELSVHELAAEMNRVADPAKTRELTVAVTSFGFKYGLPMDANNVIDVRFLANPYWVGELRHLTGLDAPVRDYVLGSSDAAGFIAAYLEAFGGVLDGYLTQQKGQVGLAVGCTGGRHRSVAVAEALAAGLRERDGIRVRLSHRDVGRE